MDYEEGEDDPIYLNRLVDESGRPIAPDMEDAEIDKDAIPDLGSAVYVQEYASDGRRFV